MLLAGLVSLHTENLMIILCLYHLFFTHHHLTHSRSLAQHWKTECHIVRWCSLCVLTAQQIEATLYSHWMWRRKKTLMINLFVCLVACLLVSVSHLVQEFVSWHLVFSNFRVRMWMSEKKHQTQANTHNHTFIYCYCYYYCYYYIVERKREK